MKKGLLIVLEGPDGCGKSTQIKLLEQYFKEKGEEVLCTREPGGANISEKIRTIILDNKNINMSPMCEALLCAASRAQLVEEVIKPAIEKGVMVICDRFVTSSIVYQGIGRNLGIDNIKSINEAALSGLIVDFTFMLMIPFELGLKRKAEQKKLDRLENSGLEFHKKVYEGYIELSKGKDIMIIDATKELIEVHKEILNKIQTFVM
ncbi:MAG TPA: dTMP kinase [Clostridiaceae bacterium]